MGLECVKLYLEIIQYHDFVYDELEYATIKQKYAHAKGNFNFEIGLR